jgi:hypothetical protein
MAPSVFIGILAVVTYVAVCGGSGQRQPLLALPSARSRYM